jgi:hypothetical protein
MLAISSKETAKLYSGVGVAILAAQALHELLLKHLDAAEK